MNGLLSSQESTHGELVARLEESLEQALGQLA
jgi:chromosome segregation ATPase